MRYGVSFGPFSQEILVGRLNKAGNEFLDKEPRTIESALAVVQWVLEVHDGTVDLTPRNGGPAFRVTVERAADHEFLPVAGHPDDDECTHRSDGTDATYCGEPRDWHKDLADAKQTGGGRE